MNTRAHPRRVRTIAAILGAMPATRKQIIERTGLNPATVVKVIKVLRATEQTHISKWLPHPLGGPSMAVLRAGPGTDAIDDLPRLTRKEIAARFEKSIRGTEKYDLRAARHRSRHWEKKAKTAPKTWAAMLFVKSKEGAAC